MGRWNQMRIVLVVLLALGGSLQGQESLADLLKGGEMKLSRPGDRAEVARKMREITTQRRQEALREAARHGWVTRGALPGGGMRELVAVKNGLPVYFITHNANAGISSGATLLNTAPYTLNGSGVTIGLWDGGAARATHQEFTGRVSVEDGAASADHATHVGGTMIAAGAVSSAHGMAASATVDSYDWTNDKSEMTSRGATAPGQADKLYLSNHSYSYSSGWTYVGESTHKWEWYGSGSTSTDVEPDFGRYGSTPRDSDSLAYNAPYYLMFRSAGNDRGDNPVAGDNVVLVPGGTTVVTYSSTSHPVGDANYRGGYDTISYDAVAKNVLTVGSASDAVTSGARDPSKANVSGFSSWGPTDDGRIKPDVVANGEVLYSSLSGTDASYGYYSGTSMATPNACGSAALLIEHYGQLFPGQAMRSSTLKGLLIHTVDDRGNVGPDYSYGWGLVNVQAAADTITDHHAAPARQAITEAQLTSSVTTRSYAFLWDGVSPIRATLCWTDPVGAYTTSSDSRTARLVNNLDLQIIDPDGSPHSPYVMPFVGTWTEASMSSPAITGKNDTDNIEQILIEVPPSPGVYRAVVTVDGSLTNNVQDFSLVITGSSSEAPPTPTPIWSENFDGTVSGWTASANIGTSYWALTSAQSHSPSSCYFASGPASKNTDNLESPAVSIPAGAQDMNVSFWHDYDLQNPYDGGVFEFSIDGGAWFDVTAAGSGASFSAGAYTTTLAGTGGPNSRNELIGQQAWSGDSGGFIQTVVELTDVAKYAGKNLRMRWRLATDSRTASPGWYVDSVALNAIVPNEAPEITTAANASPGVVVATSTALSVTADDDGGSANLTYTWATTDGPPGESVAFSDNVSSTAASTTATFTAAGTYAFTVEVSDVEGLTANSSVQVVVEQTPTTAVLTPAGVELAVGRTQVFAASQSDQFGDLLSPQPVIVWSVSGGGTIDSAGLFTASSAGGPFTVSAEANGLSAEGSVTVTAPEFDYWQSQHFTAPDQASGLADADSDPDRDGMANLIEYALGTDPRVINTGLEAHLLPDAGDVDRLTLTFSRPAGLPDLVYVVEVNDNPSPEGWEAIPALEVTANDPPDSETVIARDPVAANPSERRFIRLRVTLSPPGT